jgi:ribosomal protein S18 acetylase RimI-like enzyme
VVEVWAVNEVTEGLVRAVHRLLPQLSSSARLPRGDEVAAMVASPAIRLLVAGEAATLDGALREEGAIVGMLTLVVFPIPTGTRAWVEDVVVDGAARGRGVGEALVKEAVRLAAAEGAQTLDLTSRPSREAANRLYTRVGFELRETNVYRYPLT